MPIYVEDYLQFIIIQLLKNFCFVVRQTGKVLNRMFSPLKQNFPNIKSIFGAFMNEKFILQIVDSTI
jgi:hypothetical protein